MAALFVIQVSRRTGRIDFKMSRINKEILNNVECKRLKDHKSNHSICGGFLL